MAKTDNLTDFLTGVANAIRTKKGTTAKINPQNFETEIGSITTSKPEQEKTITITTNGSRTVTPDGGKVLSKVTITTNVPATPTQEKTAELALANGNQVISPDSGKVLSKVTIIKPVALIPENIRKNTEIGGVIGALEEAKPEQEKTAEATNSRQIISPNVGKTLSKVVIEAAPLPSGNNSFYKNTNKCLINMESKTLILGCNDSVIPSDIGITSIGDFAFSYCDGLTSVTIPDSVTSISNAAFWSCKGLTNITIPDNVISIGSDAFGGCSGIESLVVTTGNKKYHSANNCIIETETKKLIVGCKTSIIPSDGSVTSIGDSAFSGCRDLTSIIIPDSVTSIGVNAFWSCRNLTSVTISNNVTSIGNYAFYSTGLASVTIPDSVTSIGIQGFSYCESLTSAIIGNSVTSIDSYAFSYCSNLANITMLTTTPPQLGNNVFPSNVTTITVPAGCGETYKAADGWSAYADKIVEAAA